jgi:transcriptional regulator with XRE-family HTH domain
MSSKTYKKFDKTAFGIEMRKRRFQRSLEQSAVAAATGISQATLSRIENGRNEPSDRVKFELEKLYGLRTEDFFLGLVEDTPIGHTDTEPDGEYDIGGVTVDRTFIKDGIKNFPVLKYLLMKAGDGDVKGFNREIMAYVEDLQSVKASEAETSIQAAI